MSEPLPKAQEHSPTSIAAACAIESCARTLRARVLNFLKERGKYGATDEEMQMLLSMNPSTQRPRRIALCEKSMVRDSGKTRKTQSGRQATVWVAVFT